MKTISGKDVKFETIWITHINSKATHEFVNNVKARRAKNRIARKSRKLNRG